MWGITLATVIALALTVASGTAVNNEDFQIGTSLHFKNLFVKLDVHNKVFKPGKSDNVESGADFTSILLKVLESKYGTDSNDLKLQDKIPILDTFLGRNAVANTIIQVLESLRPIVINGSGSIPPLCPFVVTGLGPFVVIQTGLRLTTNIPNLRMEGLRWYVVNDVTFNALRRTVGVRMTVPWLVFTGGYNTSTWIGLVQHRSSGNFRFFINRIDIQVESRLGTNVAAGHLVLRVLNINILVSDVQTQLTGVTGSALLNGIINNLVQRITRDFVNSEMENVSRIISGVLFDVINDILKDFTLDDLLGRIL